MTNNSTYEQFTEFDRMTWVINYRNLLSVGDGENLDIALQIFEDHKDEIPVSMRVELLLEGLQVTMKGLSKKERRKSRRDLRKLINGAMKRWGF